MQSFTWAKRTTEKAGLGMVKTSLEFCNQVLFKVHGENIIKSTMNLTLFLLGGGGWNPPSGFSSITEKREKI